MDRATSTPFAVLVVFYLLSLVLDTPRASTVLLIFTLIWYLVVIAHMRSPFGAILHLVVGALGFSLVIQFGGEVLGEWVSSPRATGILLVSWLFVSMNRSKSNICNLRAASAKTIIISIPVLSVLFWLTNLSESNRVNILGYGYDNVGFVAQARMILAINGTGFLQNVSDIGPTYVLDAPQGSGALIATILKLVNNYSDSSSGLTVVLLVINCLLPVLVVACIWFGLSRTDGNGFLRVLLTLSFAVTILFSYFGRIWFSGYLSSNIATLLFLILGIHLSSGNQRSLVTTLVLVALIGHTYAPFAALALLISAPTLLVTLRRNLISQGSFTLEVTRIAAGTLAIFSTWLLPFTAIRRTFGAGQFLADGGIEPLPALQIGIVLVVLLLPVVALSARSAEKFELLNPIILALTICGLVSIYSINAKGYIAYYPTKTIITLCCFVIAFAAVPTYKLLSKHRFVAVTYTVFVSGILFHGIWDPQRIFITPYMGKLMSVVREFPDPSPMVVNGDHVVQWADWARTHRTPVLYVHSTYESELNTRWINVLAGTWTNESWNHWRTTRSLIEVEPSERIEQPEARSLVVVTDSEEVFLRATRLKIPICMITDNTDCRIRGN